MAPEQHRKSPLKALLGYAALSFCCALAVFIGYAGWRWPGAIIAISLIVCAVNVIDLATRVAKR